MILSFHPLFEGDRFINCAGRVPGPAEQAAIEAADAVVLPQGCRADLYWMARRHCPRVFPNYEARFRFAGKIGQARLFRQTGTRHPQTFCFTDLQQYRRHESRILSEDGLEFPLVFKFDWGGEGETVFRLETAFELNRMLQKAADYEHCGQKGFLLQRMIAAQQRSLRVTAIGRRRLSYWRVGSPAEGFHSAVSRGARIDCESDRDLQRAGEDAVGTFCRRTGIDLAGFDLLFELGDRRPYFLEVNWYFGRRGLGGSEAYYGMLLEEIEDWLHTHQLR